MEQYLPVMTEQYRRNMYGEGIFARVHKNTAKISWMIYIFFGVILAGSGYGVVWSLQRIGQFRENGETDMIGIGYGIMAVFAVFALISLAVIILSIVRHKRGTEELKARVAKENGYTVEDLNQFEHQALEMESRVICLLGKVAKATAGQEDGIITRDYIYLRVGREGFLKIADVRAAVLIHQQIRAGAAGTGKTTIDYLNVGLIGRGGISAVAECTKESGMALIEYLKEKCPDLYTADGAVLESREYDDLWAKFKK